MSIWFVVDSEGNLIRSSAAAIPRPMDPVAKTLHGEAGKKTLDLLEEAIFESTTYSERFFDVYKKQREISDKQEDLTSVKVALDFLEDRTDRPRKTSPKEREFNTFLRDLVTTRYAALKYCHDVLGWRPTANGARVYEYNSEKPFAFSTPAKSGEE